MESIIIYPKNDKQRFLLESLLKEMNIRFEVSKNEDESLLSEAEFYQKIDQSIQQDERGESKILSREEQKKLLGL